MPTVADDVHSGRMRPRWLPRGLSAGIVIVGKLAMSSSLCRAGTIVSNEIVNVALEVRSSRGMKADVAIIDAKLSESAGRTLDPSRAETGA